MLPVPFIFDCKVPSLEMWVHFCTPVCRARQRYRIIWEMSSVYSVISSESLAVLCIFRERDAASSSASFVCGQTLE